MDSLRFDRIARQIADRRFSRREALTSGGAGLALGTLAAAGFSSSSSAQDATPTAAIPAPTADHGPTMLFVQSYQSGSITPKDGEDGRYTLTLEQGHGQTIYFSDRPDRIVGTSPTPQFLSVLGFPDDNPPNAALVVETAPGETDVAVVELFNPLYDPETQGVTYEIEVLANWQSELEMDFAEAPTDLSALVPSFGAAQLLIDDCPDGDITCWHGGKEVGRIGNKEHDGYCYSWYQWACLPCQPWYDGWGDLAAYWTSQCNRKFSRCEGSCTPHNLCSTAWNCQV